MSEIISIRASGLWQIFDCPARWAAIHIDKIRMPASRPAHIGTCLHASTGAYDNGQVTGEYVSVDEAAGLFVDKLYHPDEEVNWEGEPKRKAEHLGLKLHTHYCHDLAPAQQYTAVEMPLEPMEIEVGGLIIRLTGTLDRIRKRDDKSGICDVKSGVNAVNRDNEAKTQGHGIQLGVYELLAENTLGYSMDLPAMILGMQTTNQARLGTGEVNRPRDVLIGNHGEKGLLEYAADMIRRGDFYGNSHSMMCHERYCPIYHNCKFRI